MTPELQQRRMDRLQRLFDAISSGRTKGKLYRLLSQH